MAETVWQKKGEMTTHSNTSELHHSLCQIDLMSLLSVVQGWIIIPKQTINKKKKQF